MPRDLAEIVRRLHRVDAVALAEAALQARRSGTDLGEVLRARGLLDEAQLLEAIAEQRGLAYLRDVATPLDPALARALPASRAVELRAVPVGIARGELVLATCERSHAGKEAALSRLLGQPVRLCLAPPRAIEHARAALYRGSDVPAPGADAAGAHDAVFAADRQATTPDGQLELGLTDTAVRAGATRVPRRRDPALPDSDDGHRTQVDPAIGQRIRAQLAGSSGAAGGPRDDGTLELFGEPASATGAPPRERTLVLSLDDVVDDSEVIEEVLELIEIVDEEGPGTPAGPQIGRDVAWYDSTGQTQVTRLPAHLAARLAPDPAAADDDEGEPFGEYRLLRCIGVGGMAEVYEARRTMVAGLTRTVALKRILPSYSRDEQFVTMFLDEAMITAQLNHPAIGQVLDVGKVGDEYFIAMEYLQGRNLEAITKHTRERGLAIPLEVAVHIVQQVLEGLDYAHRKRDLEGRSLHIVHRDVSPANVICCDGGGVKLIDFGIARAAGKVSQTRAGLIKGKVCYMSPEQLREQPMDHRSDIFAAGVLLWELLAGRSLFAGTSDRETIANIARVVVPALRELQPAVPPAVADIAHHALQREPDDRPAWASEMSEALGQAMGWHGDAGGRAALAAFLRAHFS